MTIIGCLLIIFALLSLISLLSLLDDSVAGPLLAESPAPLAVHLGHAGLESFVSALCGYGILVGLNWSRFLYLGWEVISLLLVYVISPFTSVIGIGLIFVVIFAFFLFRPPANAWFA